jgi:hypothetical protein
MAVIRKTIHIKKSHEGQIHKDLNVAPGDPIPAAKLAKALHSNDPAIQKRAQFAKNASQFHHPKKGE